MGISEADKEFFTENGFLVVPEVFSAEELGTVRGRLDDMARGRVPIPQGEQDGGRATGISRVTPGQLSRTDPTTNPIPEERLTARHARRGTQVYPLRQRPVDEAAARAAQAADDPWNEISGIQHLADHDEVFRSFAGHPNIVAVLRELIGPHVKLFFDHAFNKPPYGGANRYHQDGFFMFSDRTVTCWIALDEVTTENGCMRYIPDTLGYGMFRFDELGERVTARELEQEVLVPLRPGDAVFHDRWTLHGTGPNDTTTGGAPGRCITPARSPASSRTAPRWRAARRKPTCRRRSASIGSATTSTATGATNWSAGASFRGACNGADIRYPPQTHAP